MQFEQFLIPIAIVLAALIIVRPTTKLYKSTAGS